MEKEELKKLVKKKYNRELTDAEAEELLKKYSSVGELSEEQLESATGGAQMIYKPLV